MRVGWKTWATLFVTKECRVHVKDVTNDTTWMVERIGDLSVQVVARVVKFTINSLYVHLGCTYCLPKKACVCIGPCVLGVGFMNDGALIVAQMFVATEGWEESSLNLFAHAIIRSRAGWQFVDGFQCLFIRLAMACVLESVQPLRQSASKANTKAILLRQCKALHVEANILAYARGSIGRNNVSAHNLPLDGWLRSQAHHVKGLHVVTMYVFLPHNGTNHGIVIGGGWFSTLVRWQWPLPKSVLCTVCSLKHVLNTHASMVWISLQCVVQFGGIAWGTRLPPTTGPTTSKVTVQPPPVV